MLEIKKNLADERYILEKYNDLLKENAKMKQLLREKNSIIKKLIVDNIVLLSCTRYRLGNIIIRGLKPSIDTIKMPIRIIKLIKEVIGRKKIQKNKITKKYKSKGLRQSNISLNRKIKVAFVVTESGSKARAGDYFTAMEFGQAMKKRGWDVEFLEKRGSEDWYEINEDVNIVISLLESYDVRKIKSKNVNLITIAWARNWFEKWVSYTHINYYTYVAASSEIACEYMQRFVSKKVHLLKIACNKDRFNFNNKPTLEFHCDYCFTGSYWNDHREIVDIINPQKYQQYKFNIYGANWEKISKFSKFYKGFIEYDMMPKIYASTKIVIDDANRVTKPFGSVNSRVFDGLASGALVITNGVLGAKYTFNDLLPTYSNEDELYKIINYYLTYDEERIALVKKLQENIFKYHTYDKRLDELLEILYNEMKA